MAVVAWCCRILLGLALATAGAAKLANRTRFRDTLAAAEMLPAATIALLAWAVPATELGVGLALLIPGAPAGLGLAGAGLLIASFLAFLTAHRLRGGRELACGCFADFEHKTSTALLIARAAALGVVWALVWAGRDLTPPPLTALDASLAALALIGIAVLWSVARHVARTVKTWRAYAEEGEA